MLDGKTHTFNVYFASAELHELTAAMEERLGKVPDVIMQRGRRIDVLLEAGKKLNEFGWAKECTVHAILNEHENAHGSPSTSPGASPAPSRPPSPPPSPHLKPNLPSGADPDNYMEDEQNSGFSHPQQMEMNLNAAASADARASTGGEASPEGPTSSPPDSGVSETAAAPNQTSQSGAQETLLTDQDIPSLHAALDAFRARRDRARMEVEAASEAVAAAASAPPRPRETALRQRIDREVHKVLQTNLSSFVKHDSFYELCGLLGTKDIERSEFDALCSKGMAEASGKLDNLNDTLGEQAGAALLPSLDRIKGLAVLRKRPMAGYERGGCWGEKEIPPHPSYALLKRAKLTPEFHPPM